MEIAIILLVVAVICFVLDAARVQSAVGWTPAGWAFVVMAAIAYLIETTPAFE